MHRYLCHHACHPFLSAPLQPAAGTRFDVTINRRPDLLPAEDASERLTLLYKESASLVTNKGEKHTLGNYAAAQSTTTMHVRNARESVVPGACRQNPHAAQPIGFPQAAPVASSEAWGCEVCRGCDVLKLMSELFHCCYSDAGV